VCRGFNVITLKDCTAATSEEGQKVSVYICCMTRTVIEQTVNLLKSILDDVGCTVDLRARI
jgi:ABC-type proline/glycine betaine transport system substrate-binding protein